MTSLALAAQQWREAIIVGLLAIAGWILLLWGALDMASPQAQLMMPHSAHWSMASAAAVFVMWSVMMAAMMLPSALPMILTFAHLNRKAGTPARTWSFVAAYIVVWSGFSLLAAGLQWALQATGLTSHMIVSTSPWLTAGLLVVAGAFQFTPLKTACLRHCRTPMGFLLTDWRDGAGGAWIMGLRHGGYCLGCCWALMALLFVGGVMNLLWIAALMGLVVVEKLLPRGELLARALGAALIAAGLWKLLAVL
jgi:predicted metal-binding membrane protein